MQNCLSEYYLSRALCTKNYGHFLHSRLQLYQKFVLHWWVRLVLFHTWIFWVGMSIVVYHNIVICSPPFSPPCFLNSHPEFLDTDIVQIILLPSHPLWKWKNTALGYECYYLSCNWYSWPKIGCMFVFIYYPKHWLILSKYTAATF